MPRRLFAHARAATALDDRHHAPKVAAALERANRDLGLALSGDEIDYLRGKLRTHAGAIPTDVEADDVRAGQFRALPAQDLQCRLGHRRRSRRSARCSRMIRHTHASASGGDDRRVCRQCGDHGRAAVARRFYPDADGRYRRARASRRTS